MMPSISDRIRATSLRPISWISRGVRLVVVNLRAKNAYAFSPSGTCQTPTLSNEAGRYSFTKNLLKRSNEGRIEDETASLAVSARRFLCSSEKESGKCKNGLKKGLASGGPTICL